jgi:hypothetical protein
MRKGPGGEGDITFLVRCDECKIGRLWGFIDGIEDVFTGALCSHVVAVFRYDLEVEIFNDSIRLVDCYFFPLGIGPSRAG